MLMSAATHIQKTAPGPPATMAVATPTMLPVPTQEAITEQKVENGLKEPLVLVLLTRLSVKIEKSVFLITCPKWISVKKDVFIAMYNPVKKYRASAKGPHNTPFTD